MAVVRVPNTHRLLFDLDVRRQVAVVAVTALPIYCGLLWCNIVAVCCPAHLWWLPTGTMGQARMRLPATRFAAERCIDAYHAIAVHNALGGVCPLHFWHAIRHVCLPTEAVMCCYTRYWLSLLTVARDYYCCLFAFFRPPSLAFSLPLLLRKQIMCGVQLDEVRSWP